MSTRFLVIAAIVVTLTTGVAAGVVALAAGSGSGRDAALNAAKAAFTERGIRFGVTVNADQFKVVSKVGSDIPERLWGHVDGYAVTTFKPGEFRVISVFDGSAPTSSFAAYARKRFDHAGSTVLLARNVVYYGTDDKLAHEAMASL